MGLLSFLFPPRKPKQKTNPQNIQPNAVETTTATLEPQIQTAEPTTQPIIENAQTNIQTKQILQQNVQPQVQTANIQTNQTTENTTTLKNNDIKTKISKKEKLKKEKEKKEKEKENKSSNITAKKIFEQGMASIKDLIAPTSFSVSANNVDVSGTHAQSFYVYSYPRYIDTNWLSPLINFEANIDISSFIYPINSEDIMKVLRNKVGQMKSHVHVAQKSGKARDPLIEATLQDAEELRDQLARGEEKFFQFGLYFTVYHKDKDKLDKIVKQIQTILAGKMIMSKPTMLRQEQALNTTLPYGQDELNITRNMNTSPLSSAFPFSSTDMTSNDGVLYGLNRHNNSLIIFDRFKLPNANAVVFATSGAGKSYAVKLEILRSLMLGIDVIVIDPEDEYEELCSTVGGSYMKVSLNSDRRINPFDLPLPQEGKDIQPGDLLRTNIITLEGLLNIMLGGNLTPEEKAIIEKGLIDTYALKGITMDTENPGQIPPPTMEDLYDVLSEMKGAENLTTRLAQYTTGIYAGIFNKPTNIDLKTGLIAFSIRDLEDGLRPTAMYIILNYIWNRVRSKLKKRMLVVDEAWSLMQHEDSAKFLFGLAKRCRKYYLGLTTITQDTGDFLKNEYGKAIVTNSSMQLLLKQAPSAIENLKNIFNLTDGEKYYLLNSAQGEGIFFAGRKHVAIQIIASYSEDKIITTDPEEILKKQEAQENLTKDNSKQE